jgi:hypothetical protein
MNPYIVINDVVILSKPLHDTARTKSMNVLKQVRVKIYLGSVNGLSITNTIMQAVSILQELILEELLERIVFVAVVKRVVHHVPLERLFLIKVNRIDSAERIKIKLVIVKHIQDPL